MENHAENTLLVVSTNSKNDIKRVREFLGKNLCDKVYVKGDNNIAGKFYSKWECPEKGINELLAVLEEKDNVYIHVLLYDFKNNYVNDRTYLDGKWSIKL